jgi:PAS domain S-box-containing protein
MQKESILNNEVIVKTLIQLGADLTSIVDLEGTYLYVSPNFSFILGFSENELIGKNIFDFFHPDDLEKVKTEFSKLVNEKRVKTSIYRFKDKSNGWSWLKSTCINFLDDAAVRGIVVNSTEVTDLIGLQQVLKKRNERFEMLLRASSESIWEYDLINEELFLSDSFLKNFDIKSRNSNQNFNIINKLIHSKDKFRILRFIIGALKDIYKNEWSLNYHLMKPNGDYAYICDKSFIFRDENGKAYKILSVIKDITNEYLNSELEKIEREVLELCMSNKVKLKQVLEFYVKKLEKLFPEMRASILQVKNGKIKNITSPSLSIDYVNAINGLKIGVNEGSCGTAAFLKQKVIVSDIENDVKWEKYKDLANLYQFKACWSQPIFNKNNEVVATFANYYNTIKTPSKFEEKVFERSQRLLSVIIEKYEYLKNIQKNNERYELINKASRDAIYEWDIVNDIFYWSNSIETTLDFDKDYIKKVKIWNSHIHSDDFYNYKKKWNLFLTENRNEMWTFEFRFKKNDSSYIYVQESGYLIRDKKGNPVRKIGVLKDVSNAKLITQQKELYNQISRFFKRYSSIKIILNKVLRHITSIDYFCIAELWLLNSNKNNLNLIAKHARSIKAKKFYNSKDVITTFKINEGLPGIVFKNKKTFICDDIQNSDIFFRNEDATRANLNSAVGLPIYHNNEVIGVLILISELDMKRNESNIEKFTELQNHLGAEIKRKQKEEEMFLLFESAPEIMAIASPNGYFKKVNPAFCKLLGRSEDEITYMPFETFIHPNDIINTQVEYEETITGERKASNFINRYKTKSGNYRWISWNSSEVFDDEGNVFAYGRDVTELIELQHLLENASKLAKVGGWEIDVVNNKHYWSPMTRVIHEVSDDFNLDLVSSIAFYKEEYRELITEKVNNALKNGESFDFEAEITTAKGKNIWVRSIGNAEFVNGECVRLFGSIQDISKRKKIELENKKIAEERNKILESIGDAFFAVDNNWVVTYWNKEAEILLKKKREEILGKNLWEVYHESLQSKFYLEYHKSLKSQEIVSFEEYHPLTNAWLEVTAYPTKEGLSVYFKDISIKKIAEQKINETNERFEKLTEATNDAIWDYNFEDRELFWSKGFSTLFQYNLNNFEPSFDFHVSCIHPDDRNQFIQKMEQFLFDSSKTNWFEEYRFLKADGTYAYVMDRAIFLRNSQGNAVRAIGAMTDITYRKEYENSLTTLNKILKKQAEDLAFSNKELEQFAFIASHDLQEPLRMVTNFLSQLEKKYKDQLDEKAEMYIHYAVDGAKRMRQIILDILEFSRIGKSDESMDFVDLNQIVKDVILFQNEVIIAKKAKIKIEELPILFNHKTPLKQIFQNLISNALKYAKADEKPIIEITAEELENDWQFSVKDNGIGISEEYFDKIFEIFQRLHVREDYSGTGIGLSIVKKILENMGGKIWVESQVDQGSNFLFIIPKYNSNE